MDRRGQILPSGKWFTGLFLLFVLLVTYEFMGPLVETKIPNAVNSSLNSQGINIVQGLNSNFGIGILGLGVAYLLYLFIGGLPGQREDYRV